MARFVAPVPLVDSSRCILGQSFLPQVFEVDHQEFSLARRQLQQAGGDDTPDIFILARSRITLIFPAPGLKSRGTGSCVNAGGAVLARKIDEQVGRFVESLILPDDWLEAVLERISLQDEVARIQDDRARVTGRARSRNRTSALA